MVRSLLRGVVLDPEIEQVTGIQLEVLNRLGTYQHRIGVRGQHIH